MAKQGQDLAQGPCRLRANWMCLDAAIIEGLVAVAINEPLVTSAPLRLSGGGFSTVDLVQYAETGNTYALKSMSKGCSATPVSRELAGWPLAHMSSVTHDVACCDV